MASPCTRDPRRRDNVGDKLKLQPAKVMGARGAPVFFLERRSFTLKLIATSKLVLLATPPLFLEYEEVLQRPEQRWRTD